MVQHTQKQYSPYQRLVLIGGDTLVLLSFVWIGRSSHALSVTNLAESLATALPFLLSWFAVMPWFGVYTIEVATNWRKLVPRLLLGWAIAGPLALILRALFLGRPVLTGIIPTFALVSMAYIGIVALIWRLGYIWWIQRQQANQEGVDP